MSQKRRDEMSFEMDKFRLDGKVALVIGAVYGIGFEIAKSLAKAGATIVFNNLNQESVDQGLANYEKEGIKAHGYVCDVTDEEAVKKMVVQIIDSMMRLDVDGFIIQPTSHFRKYTNIMEKNGKKLVFFDSQLYEYRNSWVKANNYDAVYDTMQACYHEKGYRKFLMITADPNRLSTRIERSQGFVNSVEDLNVPYEQLIIEDNDPNIGKIKAFLLKHTNDLTDVLVFVPNCWALPIVFSAMKELKLKMPQIGLIGFDNIEWSGFSSPTVTTIVQPAYREGQEAMNMLIDQIEGTDNTTNQRILDCEIYWKESTY